MKEADFVAQIATPASKENGADPVIEKLDIIIEALEAQADQLQELNERLTELELTSNPGFSTESYDS